MLLTIEESQISRSQFLLFWEWWPHWPAGWALSQKVLKENILTPINVKCNIMCRSKVCCQESWCVLSDLNMIWLEQFKILKWNSCMQKIGSSLLDMTIHMQYLSKDWHELTAVKAIVKSGLGNMFSITAGRWNYLQLLIHFAWHFASQWLTRAPLSSWYCCAEVPLLSIFILETHQWWSRANRVLTWNSERMNIWMPLFWSTQSSVRDLDPISPPFAGLAHGQHKNYCIASEHFVSKSFSIAFSWIARKLAKYWKQRKLTKLLWLVLNPHPPSCTPSSLSSCKHIATAGKTS